MKKHELIEVLEDTHQELVEMLEDLPDSLLLEAGVCGNWSIKDILAHLTYWEGQTITLIFQLQRGIEQPTTAHFSSKSINEINDHWQTVSQPRPLEIIWEDFTNIRKQTIRRVKELDEKDLIQPDRYPCLKGKPLIEIISNNSYEHDEEHADEIREWLDQLDEASQNEPDEKS